MTEWKDLSEEDRIKVISGLVMVGTMFVFFFVFFQVFLVGNWFERSGLLPSGASPFNGMRGILLTIYLVIVIPTAFVTGATVAYLRKRFSEMLNALIILLVGGGYLLFVTSLLTLFDVLPIGFPIEAAIILIALALFLPSIVIVEIMRAKRSSKYLKWAFK